jgi:hypothetical protein
MPRIAPIPMAELSATSDEIPEAGVTDSRYVTGLRYTDSECPFDTESHCSSREVKYQPPRS